MDKEAGFLNEIMVMILHAKVWSAMKTRRSFVKIEILYAHRLQNMARTYRLSSFADIPEMRR